MDPTYKPIGVRYCKNEDGSGGLYFNIYNLKDCLGTSVFLVLVAMIAVAAVPHTRGIGFKPALRNEPVTPLCIGVTLLAAFLCRALTRRHGRPRVRLAATLLGIGASRSLGLGGGRFARARLCGVAGGCVYCRLSDLARPTSCRPTATFSPRVNCERGVRSARTHRGWCRVVKRTC